MTHEILDRLGWEFHHKVFVGLEKRGDESYACDHTSSCLDSVLHEILCGSAFERLDFSQNSLLRNE